MKTIILIILQIVFFISNGIAKTNILKNYFEVIKIDSIENKYLIYVQKNDSVFEIVSKKNERINYCTEIIVGNKYELHLESYFKNLIIDGSDLSPKNIQNVTHYVIEGTGIKLESECRRELFYTNNIKGLCYVNDISTNY